MRLRVISSNSTYYWSVTSAAPAKPYLQISNQYLPLTTATISGVKFKVQSGNTSYRACVYQSGYYNTTSSAVGNLSSTTALTTKSTSGYKTTTSASNFQTTGLINTVTTTDKCTIAKSLGITGYTVYIYTNASYTASRVRSQYGARSYIHSDYGDLPFYPITKNATDILQKCGGITETRAGYGFLISTSFFGTAATLTEWVSCTNGYTYSTTLTSSSYTQSGGYELNSLYFTSTFTYNAPWYRCVSYTNTFYRLGTTSSTTSGNAYRQTNVGGYLRSTWITNSSTSTIYTLNGVTSKSGPAWSESYTWQTSRMTVASKSAMQKYENFTYRWDWYDEGSFVDIFTTGNVTSTRKQTVTTSTLTCSSTSGYSGKLSSSKWA